MKNHVTFEDKLLRVKQYIDSLSLYLENNINIMQLNS